MSPGCDDAPVRTVKFRHNAATTVAALVAFFGAIPIASLSWYLTPLLLLPLLVAAWSWRAGTDADVTGVRVRALAGSRHIPWSRITHLVPDERGRVHAALAEQTTVRLPAVNATDLPRLLEVGGKAQ
jgi:hypothetical protein